MAFRTTYNIWDFTVEGHTRDWTIHRYKRALMNAPGPYPMLGTINDEGTDVPITAISVLSTGATQYGVYPTERTWSNCAGAMEFKAVFTPSGGGTVSADLEVDIEFYECAWGDSGGPERWEFLFRYSFRDGDSPIKLITDGKQIFARIDEIDNPDAAVSMQLLCRAADAEGAGGGSSGEGPATNFAGVEAIGQLVWDHSLRRWHPWRGTEDDGADVYEKNSDAILAELLAQGLTLDGIDAALEGINEDQINALAGLPGVWGAPYDFTAAYLGPGGLTLTLGTCPAPANDSQWIGTFEKTDDDAIIFWSATQHEHTYAGTTLSVEGATFEATSTFRPMYVSTPRGMGVHDAAATRYVNRTGWVASAGVPAAVNDGDDVRARADLTGSAGAHLTNALNRTNDSVTNWKQPPTGGAPGTTNISNVASTALNAGTPIPCVEVTVINNGTGWMRVGVGVQTATTGIVLQPGDSRDIEIDDVAKVQGWAQNLNDPCGWDYRTR